LVQQYGLGSNSISAFWFLLAYNDLHALVMGDGVPCFGALEIVGLLLLLFIITQNMLLRSEDPKHLMLLVATC